VSRASSTIWLAVHGTTPVESLLFADGTVWDMTADPSNGAGWHCRLLMRSLGPFPIGILITLDGDDIVYGHDG